MENKLVVDGFCFKDVATAELAQKEVETIRFIRAKSKLNTPESIWKVYHKLIENQMFVTPVGLSFLHELHDKLMSTGEFEDGELEQIPVCSASKTISTENDENRVSEEEEKQLNEDANEVADRFSAEDEVAIRDEVRRRVSKLREQDEKRIKNVTNECVVKCRNMKVAVGILIVAVIAVLVLVYFSDNSPFIDAETKVLDRYSKWEETLKAKEEELIEREKALEVQSPNVE